MDSLILLSLGKFSVSDPLLSFRVLEDSFLGINDLSNSLLGFFCSCFLNSLSASFWVLSNGLVNFSIEFWEGFDLVGINAFLPC